jgi:outer membrane protein OmpA-like peptidoglycan-associated protein
MYNIYTAKTKLRARAAFLLLFAAVVCVSAQKKITVPQDYPTIQAALGNADEGDTVYVRSGVYYENVTLVDDVVLMGQDSKNTIIDGRRKGPAVTGADGAVIAGFTVRNGTTGILCKNTRPIIKNNIILDNKGTGIHALVALPDIVNNVIYRNLWTGIFLESVRGTRTSIDHNVIMDNGYSGIFGAGRTEVLVRNNIMVGNKQYGIFLGPEARKTRIVNNNMYKNRISFNENADNQSTRQQNISADPQFVNVAFLNFNVKTASPCRGKGEDDSDIGLSQTFTPVAADSKGASELDQYFSSSGAAKEEPVEEDPFAAFGPPPQESEPPRREESLRFVDTPEEITETMVLHGVTFYGSESAELSPESYPVLDKIYESLAYYPNLRIEVGGHTDNQGRDDFNRKLSLDRARAVMNYLVDKGIERSRIRARGYGMDRPVAGNDTSDGRAQNRRVEVAPLR